MKQIALSIDVSWLQDEETIDAVRFSALQLITTWLSEGCKFGYLLFDSESSRAQNVDAAGFFNPTTNAVEEFEAKLSEGVVESRKADSVSQIETLRWAISRSITDLGWHSVTVTSPVKASRKRRQNIQRVDEPENRNMLFLFSRLPPGTLAKIRDELVTSSLGKCLQENRIELFWVHDTLQQTPTPSSKCAFLRIRDLVQLCGVFPADQLQYTSSLGPRSRIVPLLLRKSKPAPLAICQFTMASLLNPIELYIFPNQTKTEISFDCTERELAFDGLMEDPTIASILGKALALFVVTSRDAHFYRLLMELRSLRSVCFLKCDDFLFLLKPLSESAATLAQVVDRDFSRNTETDPSPKLFDSFFLERACLAEPSEETADAAPELLTRIQAAHKQRKPISSVEPDVPKQKQRNPGSPPEELSAGSFNSEESLLQQMRLTHDRAVTGRLSAVAGAQSIVSATVHFFKSDVPQIRAFLRDHFQFPSKSERPQNEWANECRIFILVCFEVVSLCPTEAETVKSEVLSAMRKLLFLTTPSTLFDFIQETLKNLYVETVRPLLQEIAETFDLPLFAQSSDDEVGATSSVGSFAEPLSGISSLGSATNSVPHSLPSKPIAKGGDPLRRMSSANLSQRQIQIPKRRNVKTQPSSTAHSPMKRTSSTRSMPTTPRGRRILKTQVVPETPVGKQAPDRVRRTQETLRRQSSIMNVSQEDEQVVEVDESPMKATPSKVTPRRTPRKTPNKTPRTSPRKQLTRRLMFSPQKKAFTSPTAISLLHLTTSPVLFKPGRRKAS
ncbi:uncharacterized protein LOC100907825 [Galendromus occidentalis]|uniref:Uncharacterized protein LOC100907825 n=1 Tax=Galendromus occidentalis TaxID=34638 RepID=A0AAJ6VUM7_9ACAR|nr:uncharacterized protein LOC100907825 [Galendromus occidentalis]